MSQSGICQNERNWFQNCVRCSICLFQHTLKYMYLEIILSRPTDQSKVTIKYECKNNRRFIYLTLYTVHANLKSINSISLVKTMNKLPLIKSINNITRMKNINKFSLVKNIIEHVMRMRVLRRPILFLRVRCSICVRCTIQILLIKTVRCCIRLLQHRSLQHTPLYIVV